MFTFQTLMESSCCHASETFHTNFPPSDPVSPVELMVDSVSRGSDSCNLTVTCSTQDSHINSFFQCNTQTCSQEGGERSEVTTSGASLHVYPVFNFIICNHSNQVSWSKDIKMAENLCTQHTGKTERKNDQLTVIHSLD